MDEQAEGAVEAERSAIYRLYDADGNLLYIGQTQRLPLPRWREHQRYQSWWGDVTRCVFDITDQGALTDAERVAILTEGPLHNKQRYPVGPRRRPQTTWESLTPEMEERLKKAGRKFSASKWAKAERHALGAIAHEAFLAGVSPGEIAHACGLIAEHVRRLAKSHAERNPDLPALPRRHGRRTL